MGGCPVHHHLPGEYRRQMDVGGSIACKILKDKVGYQAVLPRQEDSGGNSKKPLGSYNHSITAT